jgi:acetylornithine deacetylase/succinyl-diaminopimelate desuccinylase-like protein
MFLMADDDMLGLKATSGSLSPDALSPGSFGAFPSALAAITQIHAIPAVQEQLRLFQSERKWINERHLEVCRVPAPTFREQPRAEFLQELFRELGYPAQLDDAGNVVVPIVFGADLPFVAVTAHMDTVLAPRRPADVSVRPDGTLAGPGVTDNGSGLTALVALARVFRDAAPRPARRNILLVANVAEEGEGNLHGMRYLCRHSPLASQISAYLVLDGASIGHITAEALGSRRFEIVIEGRGGHSWNDFGRANPIHALGRAVALLADTALPQTPRTTLSVGVIEGGCGVNSIAAAARAKVDIRSHSAAAMQQVVEAMETAVRAGVQAENAHASDRLSSYRIREIGHRPAAAYRPGNAVVECLQAVDSYLRIPSRLDCASTDANVPLASGFPAAAIGAGGRGGDAHAPTEWFHPEGRELGLQRILLALLVLSATPA